MQPTAQATSPPSAASNKPSPDELKAELARDVKPFIQPTSFTGAGAVSQLVKILDEFGINEVDVAIRLEILTKIRDNAGNHYFRAWGENLTAMDISREWLKAAFTAKPDNPLSDTVMPLLHVSFHFFGDSEGVGAWFVERLLLA